MDTERPSLTTLEALARENTEDLGEWLRSDA